MSDLAFHALREYQPGDDRRYIHWRSSAKAGRLLVRQFLDTRRSHVTVLVDTDPEQYRSGRGKTGRTDREPSATCSPPTPPPPSRSDVETAISVGSSIMVRVMLDEQDATIVCGSTRRSAEVRPAGRPRRDGPRRARAGRPATALARRRRPRPRHEHRLPRHRSAPAASRPAAGRRRSSRPEVSKVIVVVDPDADHGIRHGGGLTILTVGRLEQLRTPPRRGGGPMTSPTSRLDPGPAAVRVAHAATTASGRWPAGPAAAPPPPQLVDARLHRRRSSRSRWSASARPSSGSAGSGSALAGLARRPARQPRDRDLPGTRRGDAGSRRGGLPAARRPDRGARGPHRRRAPVRTRPSRRCVAHGGARLEGAAHRAPARRLRGPATWRCRSSSGSSGRP